VGLGVPALCRAEVLAQRRAPGNACHAGVTKTLPRRMKPAIVTSMPSPPQAPYKIGGIEVVPADAPLGAEIRGLDLALPPDADTMTAIRRAWAAHLVLVWRGQDLSVDQHVALGRQFGDLEDMSHVAAAPGLPPEILVIENDPALNEAAAAAPEGYRQGFKDKAVVWHSDNSYRPIPPAGSLFHQREGPPEGGATHFCNMYAALESLPVELRKMIEGRTAIHDPSHNSAGVLRTGAAAPEDVSQGTGPRHPLVRSHPVTGREAFYSGGAPTLTSRAIRSPKAKTCSTGSGRMPRRTPSSGAAPATGPATSTSGITVASCTAAMRWRPRTAASPTACRSWARNRPRRNDRLESSGSMGLR